MTDRKMKITLIIAGAVLFSLLLVVAIFQSTSSTSPVGLLFLPVAATFGGITGFLVWFVGKTFVDLKGGLVSLASFRVLAAVLILISSLSFANRFFLEKGYLKEAQSSQLHVDRFWDFHRQRFLFQEQNIRMAIAENPSTPPEILQAMAEQGLLLPQLGKNSSLPSTTIEKLAGGEFSYYRMAGVAANPHLPISFMERMVRANREDFPDQTHFDLYQVYVLSPLAARKNIPQNLFDELAAKEPLEYFLAHSILRSEKLSCAQAQRLISHDNDNVKNLAERRFHEKNCK